MGHDPQAVGDSVVEDEASQMVHKDEAVEDTLASGLVTGRAFDGNHCDEILFVDFLRDP